LPHALTLAVVGADYPNKGKSPSRRFEIALCAPGDPIELRPEPKNPADENAIAVFSERGVHLGYLTAERAPLIGKYMRDGHDVAAVFQSDASFGAYIRVAFDGEQPDLTKISSPGRNPESADDSGFWPDPIYDDE
jgi:hypothetical protein